MFLIVILLFTEQLFPCYSLVNSLFIALKIEF